MAHKHPVVLVVDDEPAIAQMLEMLLEEDYQVDTCFYPVNAMAQAQHLKPDLLIIDFMMPRLNGVELLRKLRRQPEMARTPVILMTASTNLQEVGLSPGEAGELNFQVIHKPFDNNKLTALIEQLLGGYGFEPYKLY